jgi:two-component system, LytTR family, response regulator
MDDLKLRVLIADDERPARARLRRWLAEEPDILAIHEAWDGPTTLDVIRDASPDVVFLDITMPGATGMDIAESLPADAAPYIIFVTAHEEYAVRAFDTSAVDYLLKPVDRERFRRAFDRARRARAQQQAGEDVARLTRVLRTIATTEAETLDRILVDEGGRRIVIDLDDVDRVEADRNYVLLHTGATVHRTRGAISDLEQRLEPRRFARVGRGTIINLSRVRHLEPAGHGDYIIVLRDATRVRLSRRYAAAVVGRMGVRRRVDGGDQLHG